MCEQELHGPIDALKAERAQTLDAVATAFRKGRSREARDLQRRAEALKDLIDQKKSEAAHAMLRAR